MIQSFAPGEVTPEQAMQIGEELCDRYLKGDYQYVIAVHHDKSHLHCHIIFNNTNLYNGLSFTTEHNQGRKSERAWAELREISDEICAEHGISVISEPEKGHGVSHFERNMQKEGKSWKDKLRVRIAEVMLYSRDFKDFLEKCSECSIEYVYKPSNKVKLKFRLSGDGQQKFTRADTLGADFTPERIAEQIAEIQEKLSAANVTPDMLIEAPKPVVPKTEPKPTQTVTAPTKPKQSAEPETITETSETAKRKAAAEQVEKFFAARRARRQAQLDMLNATAINPKPEPSARTPQPTPTESKAPEKKEDPWKAIRGMGRANEIIADLEAGGVMSFSELSGFFFNTPHSDDHTTVSADFDIVKSKDWTVSVSANLTTTKNKIVKLPEQNKKKTVYPIDPSGKLGQREDLPVGITSGSYLISEGKSRYDYYTYHWAGVDEMDGQSLYEANLNDYYIVLPDGSQLGGKQKLNDEGELMWDANGNPVQGATELAPENYRLINGKYYVLKTTYAQKKWAGSALPTTYGSFSANIRWKNINISAMFTYSLGGKIYDSPYSSLMTPGQSAGNYHVDLYNNAWRINDRSNAMITTYKNAYDDAYNAAIAAGQTTSEANYAGYYAANKAVDGNGRINPNTNPEINNLTSTDNNAGSDRWLVSRNYLCFKNLNISYTLPKRWTAKVNLSTVRFLFSAENIHLWSARKGMNPMMGIGGGQSNYLVPARVFTFGINAYKPSEHVC